VEIENKLKLWSLCYPVINFIKSNGVLTAIHAYKCRRKLLTGPIQISIW